MLSSHLRRRLSLRALQVMELATLRDSLDRSPVSSLSIFAKITTVSEKTADERLRQA